MQDISQIFHIEWKILLAQAVNFCLVVFLLWRYAFGPISKVLQDRSEKIAKGLEMAEEAKESLALSEEKIKSMIKVAQVESQKIVKDSFEAAAKVRQSELAKAKAESEKIIETGKKSFLLEKENILNDIRKEAVELVVSATRATLKEVSDVKIDKALAEEIIKNI